MIGNNQLTKEKYNELKSKLLTEITQELKNKKRINRIFKITRGISE